MAGPIEIVLTDLGRLRHSSIAVRVGPAEITLKAEDERAVLPVVATERAPDNAIRRYVCFGHDAIVHDCRTAPEVTKVPADIEAGPANQLWQTDFNYLKVTGWGWFYACNSAPPLTCAGFRFMVRDDLRARDQLSYPIGTKTLMRSFSCPACRNKMLRAYPSMRTRSPS
jgi:hypothetical protein